MTLDLNTKKLAPIVSMLGFGGGGNGLSLRGGGGADPYLFVMSRDSSSNKHIHVVKTDATVVGQFSVNQNYTSYSHFRIGDFLYYGGMNGQIYKVNLKDFTAVQKSGFNNPATYGFTPISANKFISVSPSTYWVTDISTDTVTSTSYSSSSYGGWSSNLATVGFTVFGQNVFSPTSNKVFSGGGAGSPFYQLYINRQNISNDTISSTDFSYFNTGGNYSRTFGVHDSHGNVALIIRDDSGLHSCKPNSVNTLSYTALSGWNRFYNNSTNFGINCIADGRWYHLNYRTLSTYDYEFALVYKNVDPNLSGTVVDTGIRIPGNNNTSSYAYSRPAAGTYIAPINTDGWVAIAYWDNKVQNNWNTDRLVVKVIDRNNNVVSNNSVNIGASYTGGNASDTYSFGFIGHSFVTDTLYNGSKYI